MQVCSCYNALDPGSRCIYWVFWWVGLNFHSETQCGRVCYFLLPVCAADFIFCMPVKYLINTANSLTSTIQRSRVVDVLVVTSCNIIIQCSFNWRLAPMEHPSAPLISKQPAGYQSAHTTDPSTQYPVRCIIIIIMRTCEHSKGYILLIFWDH